ncbi:MarR family winged helix-turn-helix transcriptional regulator [Microbacterium sp.]|uniref:MarR family winged helix-turn-helix transcriptional regulator n=1 Tax=Microbacterium sp. TaxID=51671 RepID=UPI003A8ABE2F
MPTDLNGVASPRGSTDRSAGADRLWASTVGGDLAFLLARANAVSIDSANAALSSHQLTVRSYSVLALAVSDSRPSQKELADFLRLDPSQVVALVDDLERRTLVRRKTDPADRRAKVVVVTASGRTLYAQARAAVVADEEQRFGGLSARERDLLAKALRQVSLSVDRSA